LQIIHKFNFYTHSPQQQNDQTEGLHNNSPKNHLSKKWFKKQVSAQFFPFFCSIFGEENGIAGLPRGAGGPFFSSFFFLLFSFFLCHFSVKQSNK